MVNTLTIRFYSVFSVAELVTLCDLDLTDLHLSCKHNLQTLREEFERYKLRAQSVLKSKSSKVAVTNIAVRFTFSSCIFFCIDRIVS